MNSGVNRWLFIMIIPFCIGVIIQFIVPLSFILQGHKRVQVSYNFLKAETEQETVRAISYMNSKVVENRIQTFINIRAALARIFITQHNYMSIQPEEIPLNSAWQLANSPSNSTPDLSSAMWYAPGTTSFAQLTSTQQQLVFRYQRIQPSIQSYFTFDEALKTDLPSFEITLAPQDSPPIYFRYPSEVNPIFSTTQYSPLTQYYNDTICNFEKGYEQSLFRDKDTLKLCVPLLFQWKGVVCFNIVTKTIVKQISNSLSSPKFNLSSSDFYLLLPIYPTSSNQDFPELIANFSSLDLRVIEYYTDRAYFPLDKAPCLSREMFSTMRKNQLSVNRQSVSINGVASTTTFYTSPIVTTIVYNSNSSLCMYLVVMNTHFKTQLFNKSYYRNTLITLIIPTLVLLIISLILTSYILKKSLSSLQNALVRLNQYLILILKGDLDLQIPSYKGTEDIVHLFQAIQTLNLLTKYSDSRYFDVPPAERLVKYLKCAELFQSLGYRMTNLYQNIADCYFAIGDHFHACQYISQAINDLHDEISVAKLGKRHRNQWSSRGLSSRQRFDRRERMNRKKNRQMRRMMLKEINYFWNLYKTDKSVDLEELIAMTNTLKKFTFPRVVNNEYLAACIIYVWCRLEQGVLDDVGDKMEELNDIISGYEELYSKGNDECKTPPSIMRSYCRFNRGNWHRMMNKPAEALKFYFQALQGTYFDPKLHQEVLKQISLILQENNVNVGFMDHFTFRRQYLPRENREYLFLIDSSNPNGNTTALKIWKQKCRQTAEYIFKKFITFEDRFAIYDFCKTLQVRLYLTNKHNQPNIMNKQIFSSFRSREMECESQILPCLQQAMERVKHLKQQKVFLIFLKDLTKLDGEAIDRLIRSFDVRSTFIFFSQKSEKFDRRWDSFYVMASDAMMDVKRLIGKKVVKPADMKIPIF